MNIHAILLWFVNGSDRACPSFCRTYFVFEERFKQLQGGYSAKNSSVVIEYFLYSFKKKLGPSAQLASWGNIKDSGVLFFLILEVEVGNLEEKSMLQVVHSIAVALPKPLLTQEMLPLKNRLSFVSYYALWLYSHIVSVLIFVFLVISFARSTTAGPLVLIDRWHCRKKKGFFLLNDDGPWGGNLIVNSIWCHNQCLIDNVDIIADEPQFSCLLFSVKKKKNSEKMYWLTCRNQYNEAGGNHKSHVILFPSLSSSLGVCDLNECPSRLWVRIL